MVVWVPPLSGVLLGKVSVLIGLRKCWAVKYSFQILCGQSLWNERLTTMWLEGRFLPEIAVHLYGRGWTGICTQGVNACRAGYCGQAGLDSDSREILVVTEAAKKFPCGRRRRLLGNQCCQSEIVAPQRSFFKTRCAITLRIATDWAFLAITALLVTNPGRHSRNRSSPWALRRCLQPTEMTQSAWLCEALPAAAALCSALLQLQFYPRCCEC